jgi:hypothetical protein
MKGKSIKYIRIYVYMYIYNIYNLCIIYIIYNLYIIFNADKNDAHASRHHLDTNFTLARWPHFNLLDHYQQKLEEKGREKEIP